MPVATYASYALLVCSASFRAGAITSANRIGVSSGTNSSRGVRTVRWKRRRASVASGPSGFRARRGSGLPSSWVRVVIGRPFGSGGVAQLAAGEAQVDVVERGLSRVVIAEATADR